MDLGMSQLLDSIRDVELLEIKIQERDISVSPKPEIGGSSGMSSVQTSFNQSLSLLMSGGSKALFLYKPREEGDQGNEEGDQENPPMKRDWSHIREERRVLKISDLLGPDKDVPAIVSNNTREGRIKGFGATVIVFLRRFGCGVCRLAALELSSIHDTLAKHNIRLVAIGVEELGYQEFVLNKFFHGEIYIDTKLEAFERLGLKKLGVKNGFGLLSSKGYQAMLAMAAGASSTLNFKGNFLQLGGVLIVNPERTDLWMLHKEQFAGDRPSLYAILEKLGLPEDQLQFYAPQPGRSF